MNIGDASVSNCNSLLSTYEDDERESEKEKSKAWGLVGQELVYTKELNNFAVGPGNGESQQSVRGSRLVSGTVPLRSPERNPSIMAPDSSSKVSDTDETKSNIR